MNIFGSKGGHLNNSKNCKLFFIFAISDDFSEFCSIFGTPNFEKLSCNWPKMEKKMRRKRRNPISLWSGFGLIDPITKT